MLEKIAEMVREGWSEDEFDYVPCQACIYAPLGGDACDLHKHGRVFPDKEAAIDPGIAVYTRECPNPSAPDGSLMLARWAVLLVARALEKEAQASQERKASMSLMVNNTMRCAAGMGGCEYSTKEWNKETRLFNKSYQELGDALLNLITEAKEGGE